MCNIYVTSNRLRLDVIAIKYILGQKSMPLEQIELRISVNCVAEQTAIKLIGF